MSFFLLLIAIYIGGEALDIWDIYSGTDPENGDAIAAYVCLGLLLLSFIAWGIEQIRDAIKDR